MGVIKFTRVREVKLPIRGHKTDAGIDFFVPSFTDEFVDDLLLKNQSIPRIRIQKDKDEKTFILLAPHERINIPSGIHCLMEDSGRALIANNKSGIASKHGLIFGASVVDYEYQGEIHINVINTSDDIVHIYEGMKIIQFIETPVFNSEIEEVLTLEDLYESESKRSAGGFGYTGI
jgi:deoxyuridine 5'-triphosphate nucleotidohydrolase